MAEVNTIKRYDTVKDKNGKRFRVIEIKSDGTGHITAVLKGINPDGTARRGMPRRVSVDVLESEYTRINLPEVTVRKIDDLREEETEVTQVPAPHERAAQIEAQAVRELSVKDIKTAVDASTFGGEEEAKLKRKVTDSMQTIYELRKDIEILKTECLALKEENKKHLREIDDYKKTISKMKYAHEEEVRSLEDDLMEAKALAKHNADYAETVGENNATFSEIMHLAEVVQLVSTSTAKIAKEIIEKTEERI